MLYFKFNEIISSDIGLGIQTPPTMMLPEEDYETSMIPGYGEIIIKSGIRKAITITLRVNFLVPESRYYEQYRVLRKALTGSGKLIFSNDNEYYYKVLDVSVPDGIQGIYERAGILDVSFKCSPEIFPVSGDVLYSLNSVDYIDNKYDVSYPEYTITGNGLCTIELNNVTTAINVLGSVTVYTELGIAVNDGTDVTSSIVGDTDNLLLKEGRNTFIISDGFSVQIKPRWRIV